MPLRVRRWSASLSVLAAAVLVGPALAPAAAVSPADGPAGFWYGTDSSYIHVFGPPPYHEPVIGGSYGGYFGMYGNWARQAGCGKIVVWANDNSAEAHANYATYHRGVGVGGYWFMGGPGVDPNYDGSTSEAAAWGARQAAWTLADMASRPVTYPVVFMDVELPGDSPSYTPAADNGWNSVYTSACSGQVRINFIPVDVDRATLNGYSAYLRAHSSYYVGVYSAPDVWTSIFGTGTASQIPNTYEWTYESFTSSLSHHPYGWCLSGTHTCARFFGGQTIGSRYALMWQWSGGGGSYNGHGDFDQIDSARTPRPSGNTSG